MHPLDTSGVPTSDPGSPLSAPAMPLSRTLSVSSLPGLEEWEDEFDLENAVLFEVAWEVANKGEHASARALDEKGSRGWEPGRPTQGYTAPRRTLGSRARCL